MTSTKSLVVSPWPRQLAVAVLASLGVCGNGWAEPNPFSIGAAQAFTRESNVFRATSDNPPPAGTVAVPVSSDTISTTSLLASLNQPIGRQRLFADAALRLARYSDNTQLNHSGGNLTAGLDWEAAESLAGRLSFTGDKSLAPYGVDVGLPITSRNMQTTQEIVLRGQSGLVQLFSVEAGLVHRDVKFSEAAADSLEFKQDAASVGVRYRPSGALTLGLAYRRTDGTFPFAAPGGQADDFKRNDVDVSAVWAATGASTLTARISRTSEEHEVLPTRDLSGTTGALSWNFKPTGKLELIFDYLRDTGAEASFEPGAGAGAGGGAGAPGPATIISSPLANTVQLRVEYQVTAKFQMFAVARQVERDLVSSAGARGDDRLLDTRLGLTWAPLRSVTTGCSFGRERRSASADTVTQLLSSNYSANTVRCSAQFKTQ